MAAKKVSVVLDTQTAGFSVDLTGFQGKGCADIARAFENLGDVKTSIKKPEYKAETLNVVRK